MHLNGGCSGRFADLDHLAGDDGMLALPRFSRGMVPCEPWGLSDTGSLDRPITATLPTAPGQANGFGQASTNGHQPRMEIVFRMDSIGMIFRANKSGNARVC